MPAETPKAPWRPKTAASIGFFFSPAAGAIVSAISLRRMGHPEKARKVIWFSAMSLIVFAVILFFTPDVLVRFLGLGMEAGFCLYFVMIQDKEFGEWAATHAETNPSRGWWALGWGLIGLLLCLAILFLVVFVLGLIFPGRV